MTASFFSLTQDEVVAWLRDGGAPAYVATQLLEWVYSKGVSSWEQMTNLSLALRKRLQEAFVLAPPMELQRVQESTDQETIKFLWRLSDGRFVESVLIMADARRTVCVSSQVGCPAKCAFCASGRMGFFRNLECGEIVAQVYAINRWLHEQRGERVSHVVFMGMGEPFRNYDAVVRSIGILNHPQMMGISQRRITVSTVGVVEGIVRFAEEPFRVNLVLSLHAPNQMLRRKIIPYARQYELTDILQAMEAYAQRTHRDITYEYVLLAGLNDQPEHARELAALLKGKQCTVNLIPYNPVEGLKLERPASTVIREFRDILDAAEIVNTCRYTKGDDIAAACGQLAIVES